MDGADSKIDSLAADGAASPRVAHRPIAVNGGVAIGCSYGWEGGQYCSLNTARGVVGCGIFDIAVADRFNMAFAIARGTPEHPLREPEDLLGARIVEVSAAAARLGIAPGMTGREALQRMLGEAAN